MEKINRNLIKAEDRKLVLELLLKLKIHSKETFIHSLDVANKSVALASAFHIKNDDLNTLYTASLLHDIGKLYIDRSLLHKKNATETECETIKLCHIIGTKAILGEYFDADFVKLASHHHERLNSTGYPEHLSGRKLNMLDRILQVADVTSALELARSYKEAYNAEQVITILDQLVHRGELDYQCVEEMKKIILAQQQKQVQYGS